jgi:hypothetical protein
MAWFTKIHPFTASHPCRYLTVFALFGSLGFGVMARPLCICIGFNSEHAMHRVRFAQKLTVCNKYDVL